MKCWDEEYYITFQIPSYVLSRKIVKFTLPLIRFNKKTGQYDFIFSIIEEAKQRKGWKHTAGIDLGIVKPYSMAITNENGQRVASYDATARLTKLSRKRERLIAETKNISKKIINRAARGLESPAQENELALTRAKATRLTKTIAQQTGAEIAQKLAKHNSSLVKLEKLSWISGTKKSKIGSSRWSHSQQQQAITHAASRIGYKTQKVNPRNTSQECHKCKQTITHQKNRTVWCKDCKHSLDRDFNAAMNIATQQPFPASQKLNGATTITGVTLDKSKGAFSGIIVPLLPILVRKTT